MPSLFLFPSFPSSFCFTLPAVKLLIIFYFTETPPRTATLPNSSKQVFFSDYEDLSLIFALSLTHELELELIQTHMVQKPMLRVEVCVRCVPRESKHTSGLFGWASAVCRALAGCVWSV
jgi:hypothetical protein